MVLESVEQMDLDTALFPFPSPTENVERQLSRPSWILPWSIVTLECKRFWAPNKQFKNAAFLRQSHMTQSKENFGGKY